MEELNNTLKTLKKGKGQDGRGIVAEMYKHSGGNLKQLLLHTINEAIKPEAIIPEEWKKTQIMVLFKSGNPMHVKNYRPISIISILYKIFATMLGRRLELFLGPQQSKDQAGFRKGFSTNDHMFAASILIEKCQEWNAELWIAAVDYKKAFDSVEHECIWQALKEQGVPQPYIHLMERLYSGQVGQVCLDKQSRIFDILRGTKQGDPLSSLLFNAVSESIFRRLKAQWHTKKMGVDVGIGELLTNVRFADDVLLIADSRARLKKMLEGLQDESAKTGLNLHPDKTKVLTNATISDSQLRINNDYVEIIPHKESVKYLGRKLCMTGMHEAELDNRIRAAWATFTRHREELTNKKYSLYSRLRLFNATVGAAVLYGCESWTLRLDQQRRLKTTQRKMLRAILGNKRRVLTTSGGSSASEVGTDFDGSTDTDADLEEELEPWTDFLKRTTRNVEDRLQASGQEEWLKTWRRKQWQWAGKVVRDTTGKWSQLIFNWCPTTTSRRGTYRRQARPIKRWEDDFRNFVETVACVGSWRELAADESAWTQYEEVYVKWACGHNSRHDCV